MSLKDTYNRIAKDWIEDHDPDTWWVSGTDEFIKMLPKGAKVLDVGCGGGIKTKYLSDHGLAATGADFSEEMIRLVKERFPKINFFVQDIRQPIRVGEGFDGVFAQAVLLHIPKKEVVEVLKNLLAPLKPGGLLYVAVKKIKLGKPEEEVVKENDYNYDYERFFSYFVPEEMANYFAKAGLKIIWQDIVSSGKTDWIQIVG